MTTDLQAIVDIEAGNHHEEPISVNASDERLNNIRIPGLVRLVHQAVDSVGTQKRDSENIEPAESNFIILLGLLLSVGEFVLVFEYHDVGQEGKEGSRRRWSQANIDRLRDLPSLQKDPEPLACKNHPRRIFAVIHQVQENNRLHEDIGQNGAD